MHGPRPVMDRYLDADGVWRPPYLADDRVTVWHADCLVVLRAMPDASAHAVITDPPYGLEFMGRDWDNFRPGGKRPALGAADGTPFRRNAGTPSWGAVNNPVCRNCGGTKYDRTRPNGCKCDRPDFPNEAAEHMRAFQAWCGEWAAEALRVLTPGGYLIAFGGTRTWHRLTAGIEDAGFEIRDTITWLYGQGMPKSENPGRQVDRRICREAGTHVTDDEKRHQCPLTAEGDSLRHLGTALKPAQEPIVVARKPLAGTVASNVLRHGVGALNIDGARTAAERPTGWEGRSNGVFAHAGDGTPQPQYAGPGQARSVTGRWPANVVLTHDIACHGQGACTPACPVAELDAQTGGAGGAARFFPVFRWQAKARTAERPAVEVEGAGGGRVTGLGGKVRECTACGTQAIESGSGEPSCGHGEFVWVDNADADEARGDLVTHETVKPLELMRWIVRLVVPPDGVVLEPFGGSGTTAEACILEGVRCVLVERDARYLPLIAARVIPYRSPAVLARARGRGVTPPRRPRKATGADDALFDLGA